MQKSHPHTTKQEKIIGHCGPFSFILLHNLILVHTRDEGDTTLFKLTYVPKKPRIVQSDALISLRKT